MKKKNNKNILLCKGYKFSVETQHYYVYGGFDVDLVKVCKVGDGDDKRYILFDFTTSDSAEGMTPAEAMEFLIKVPKKYFDKEFNSHNLPNSYGITWLGDKIPMKQYLAAYKLMEKSTKSALIQR